ncbi:MAG TPA: type VI secretion protein [Deltaproteobacteria bacterium]|nr:type VI secretion protein [Deltaproteobacteria bacterium]
MKADFSDLLFLGLTRPAMFLGVTQSFFVINGLLNTILFLALNSFLPLFLLLPLLHGLGYLACLKDPRTFDLWIVYAKHCTQCRNKRFWGTNSYSPS